MPAEITPTLQLIRVQRPHLYHTDLISQPGPCEPLRLSEHSTGAERNYGSHERELLIAGCQTKKASLKIVYKTSLVREIKSDLLFPLINNRVGSVDTVIVLYLR